ncbi:VanZ family protein [Endozoicomonas gorgoniicola]|uniref:VanZ family protein n=1 Tax=Endozoicomonas gorgoniicola TaxID=1234144 RepID=A0ABT3MPW6_9GAMM|nr:VanZ family protein [Endozoicomonas gorgoniicola]MCW7551419.1 VanZ family protein [Endozoicomonas gorgoniicola]
MEAIIKKHYTFLARVSLAIALITMTILGLIPTEQIPLSDWNDKAQHIIAFLILTFLVDASWPETELNWKKALALLGYGLLLEVLQGFTDYRELSGLDLLADAAGIGLYTVTIPLFKKIPVINWRWDSRFSQN